MKKQPAIYILSNKKNGTLYAGVTSNLVQRIEQHKMEKIEGFSKKYGCKTLVYYELYETMDLAIQREKQIKKFSRTRKKVMIERVNQDWEDLFGLHLC